MPALPLDEAGAYVAAAYAVFVVLLVVYVAIMAKHVTRVREDLRQLAADVSREEP
jgi:heme exporter protein D